MPYRSLEMRQYARRCSMRTRRHGNWRQIYVDCNGMCQCQAANGGFCGETEHLEFHEPFGEAHNGDGRMQARILLSTYHHYLEHLGENTPTGNPEPNGNKLQADITFELTREGSCEAWLKRYGLKDGNGRES